MRPFCAASLICRGRWRKRGSRQAAIEATPQQDFFYYAQPTELAVASAFQHTATIAARPQNSDILHQMGRVFGRIMYLLDSYEDYDEDLAKNKFNALAAAFAPHEIDAQAERLFRQSHKILKRLFLQLDLPRPTVVNAAKSINDANGVITTVAIAATVAIVTSVSAKMAAAKSANVNAAAANAAMWIAAVAAVVAVVEAKAATRTVAVMTIKHAVCKREGLPLY